MSARRARIHVREARPRYHVEKQRSLEIAKALFAASRSGDMAALGAMLAADVSLHVDGGGIRPATHAQLREIDRALVVLQRIDDVARRLATIPGIGPVGATALAAAVTDPSQFRSGRQFAAWLGLTPLQNSSGGKERLGRITKMGDKYVESLRVTQESGRE